MRWIKIGLAVAIAAILVLLFLANVYFDYSCWSTNEDNAASSISTMKCVQDDFMAEDRDGNGVGDYWRSDVRGLYDLKDPKDPEGRPIRLIEVSIARADAAPTKDGERAGMVPAPSAPKAGYWYRAIRFADEKDKPAADRFAVCAYPHTPGATGVMTFIVSHDGVVRCKETELAGVVDTYPRDPAAEGWITKEEWRERRHKKRNPLWWLEL